VAVATTYGDRLLQRAEFRAARHRRIAVLLPLAGVASWALADLVAARHGRLIAQGAGALRHAADHLIPIAWTVFLVVGAAAIGLKPKRSSAPLLVSILAGPVLSPALFGPGGWHPWQMVLFLPLALFALTKR
jgi:hypothetical protein